MQSPISYTLVDVFGKYGVPVMNENVVGVIGWYCLSELLHGPLRSGMRRDIDVKDAATGMFNDHKDIEHAKCRHDRHTEVTRHDPLGMIADKRGPTLR